MIKLTEALKDKLAEKEKELGVELFSWEQLAQFLGYSSCRWGYSEKELIGFLRFGDEDEKIRFVMEFL